MKDDDYGYFGKGLDGYVHYTKSFDKIRKGEGVSSSNSGCLTSILMALGVIGGVIAFFLEGG